MSRLYAALVRHGDYQQLPGVPSAHQPFSLKPAGERQARDAATELAALISRNRWELEPVIDSSRMLRAWQTATVFAQSLEGVAGSGLGVESFDALAERGVGCAANLTTDQIEAILQEDPRYTVPPEGWKADSHYRLPLQGAESLMEAGQRVATHLEQAMSGLARNGSDRLKIFVGHGAAYRHAACRMGLLTFEQIRQYSMFHCRPVLVEYLPDGQWRHVGGEWKLRGKRSEFTD